MNHRFAVKTAAIAAVFAFAASSSFAAETTWQKAHPRRVQVNSRLAHQDQRIHNEVKDGQITKGQAAALHQDDHTVRQEERGMASQDGGHLTKVDQRALNQQENGVSRAIGK